MSARESVDRQSVGSVEPTDPKIDDFLGEPTRDLASWEWLWSNDRPFPTHARGGFLGRLVAFCKRALRPLVTAPQSDLWDRQRTFNLILLETLVKQQEEYRDRLEEHQGLLERLDARTIQGLQEVMRHNDALFSRVDQKLDRYRREAKDLWHRLGAILTAVEDSATGGNSEVAADDPSNSGSGLRRASELLEEQSYLSLEEKYRGSESDIAARISAYLPHLEACKKSGRDVLDLGCGRGEALEVFTGHGLSGCGVDSSSEMVARCREKGLRAEQGDLFSHLASLEEGSLGAVVSFHVIEHLPAETLPKLCRLAWRALAPGGVLILETPSPLSMVMAARNFWIDPTHLRPVHPAHLEVTYREAGFEPVHRIDLHPFSQDDVLPEIDLEALPEDQHLLAHEVNRLRDLLDDLLFGYRDFALLGTKA
ncbi:MAG: methyltransferase domain-containing protein [Thermoanaerobaculia bacterium]|nr:methyltransferase domain-containing protein [Thermoanaerobaculia bacterium]